jgi:hypothetical protein
MLLLVVAIASLPPRALPQQRHPQFDDFVELTVGVGSCFESGFVVTDVESDLQAGSEVAAKVRSPA